jgi:hypothetical protein
MDSLRRGMERVTVTTDIHAKLPALDAALARIGRIR